MKRSQTDPELSCAEFRRRLQVEPERYDTAMLQHAERCDACARWDRQAAHFERALRQALDVEPPEALERRILDTWETHRKDFRRPGRAGYSPRAWSLATSLALALGIAVWVGLKPSAPYPQPRSIENLVLQHVNAELEHLQPAGVLHHSEVAPVLKALGGELVGRLGAVSFAGVCDLQHRRIAHLVVRGEQGAVTLLFLPEFFVSAQTSIRSRRFSGLILPADFGSLAVVGDAGTSLERLARQVRGAVVWST